jgi:HK97 family phage major capsid protein
MDKQSIALQIEQKLREADAIEAQYKDRTFPEDVRQKLVALMGEVDSLRALLEAAKAREQAERVLYEPKGDVKWRPAVQGEGDEEVDVQAWREVEVPFVRRDVKSGMYITDKQRIRFHVPLRVQVKGYPDAFEAYLRKGFDGMGPNDRKTLLEGSDTAGGFLVPADFQTEIIRKVAAQAVIRSRARVVTTARDVVQWPRVNYTTDDKYTSGVRLTWTGEAPASGSAHRVTDPVFGIWNVAVHTAMASMPISLDLIEDSAFDVVGVASDLLAEAFALGEDNAFINGTGAGQPMGILADVDGDGPASVISGNASALTAGGIIDLAYALPAQYDQRAVWVMSKATEKEIRKLTYGSNAEYIWPIASGSGFASAPNDLLGYPVLHDEFVPAVAANSYPIIFGDLSGYVIVDRVGLSIQRLNDASYAELNQLLILARKRVGGQLVEPYRIKVQKVAAS